MNKNVMCALGGLLAGSAISSIATTLFLKKKYEAISNEEIESVREMYKNKLKKSSGAIFEKTKSKEEESQDLESAKEIIEGNNYTVYSDYSREKTEENNTKNNPYVIPPEEFGELEDYGQMTLMFYADQIVADISDKIVENLNSVIGFDSLNHFGEYEDDAVYVRNDRFKCDYEILKDLREYSDVIKSRSHKS